MKNERKARNTGTSNVLEKIEKIQETREKEIELRVKEVAEKIKTKFDIAEKNKAELAAKLKKSREEQVLRNAFNYATLSN